jgi:ABC-type transport system involved in cytochrome bd biosynthesis fused ATPase/permease subunit
LALAYTVPNLAAIVSVVVYVAITKSADPAVIFPVISLFNVLRYATLRLCFLTFDSHTYRAPLLLLPRAFSATIDAANAFQRLSKVFEAEVVDKLSIPIDKKLDVAIKVTKANFSWETPASTTKNIKKTSSETISGTDQAFALKELDLQIAKGSLCAIVGTIGSGKSSLLSSLIGEISLRSGSLQIGGSIAYTSQTPWIQNASLVSGSLTMTASNISQP